MRQFHMKIRTYLKYFVNDCSRRSFFKKSELSNVNTTYFYVIKLVFIVQLEDYQNILKLRCSPLAFTSNKAILKNKEV